jgi:hypothetical protein
MVQPINYQLNVQSPFEAALSGFKIGATISDIAAQRQAQEIQRQAQEEDLKRKQALQTQVQALIQNPNPSARDFTNIAMLLPKNEADSMRANWETLSKDRQENELRFGGQVMSAFSSNQPQIGVQLLKERATAERNAGREQQAKAYETWAQMAEVSPQSAQKTIGIMLAGVPGGDKVLTSSIQALKAPAEIRAGEATATKEELVTANTPTRLALENTQTAANIRNLDSTIADRAGRLVLDQNRLKLDRDRLQSDVELKLFELNQKGGQLDASATKIVNDAAVAAVGSEQAAGRMLDLASRLEQQGGGYGTFSGINSWFRNATGNQDAWTQTRQEYVRLRNTQAIKSLPPGPATDRDIELALKGFPAENADAKTVASFLRGMAKMSQYEAVSESAKSEWVNSVGSLGRATRDVEIGGVQVPRGTTYVDFARQFMDQRAQDLAATQAGRAVANRGYMRWAQPETGAVPGAAAPTAPAPAAPAPTMSVPAAPAMPAPGTLGSGTFQVPAAPASVAPAAPMSAPATVPGVPTAPAAAAAPADVTAKTQQLETVVKRLLNDRIVQSSAGLKEALEAGVRDIASELLALGLTREQVQAIIARASEDRSTFKR